MPDLWWGPGTDMGTFGRRFSLLQELQPQMVGIGPFIPHHDTKFAKEEAGSVDLTLKLLSVLRLLLPKVLLPATTALGTLDPLGREKGLSAGANVVMPNLSPVENRKQYELYDNKICTGDEAAKCKTVCLPECVLPGTNWLRTEAIISVRSSSRFMINIGY